MKNMQEMQNIEQALHSHAMQKRAFQSQLAEVESALAELSTEKAYKIVGNIMVETNPVDIKADLEEKQKVLQRRVESSEKQEKQLQDELKRLQDETLR